MSASNTRETGVGMLGYGFMGERATRGRRLPRIASA
jgi:hypothetical protein